MHMRVQGLVTSPVANLLCLLSIHLVYAVYGVAAHCALGVFQPCKECYSCLVHCERSLIPCKLGDRDVVRQLTSGVTHWPHVAHGDSVNV